MKDEDGNTILGCRIRPAFVHSPRPHCPLRHKLFLASAGAQESQINKRALALALAQEKKSRSTNPKIPTHGKNEEFFESRDGGLESSFKY
jgi:hypothetical protein